MSPEEMKTVISVAKKQPLKKKKHHKSMKVKEFFLYFLFIGGHLRLTLSPLSCSFDSCYLLFPLQGLIYN